jgi:hypothetical protein
MIKQEEKKYIVTTTDKNLGPAILETNLYIQYALDDHLLNQLNYQKLSENEANAKNKLVVFRVILAKWIDSPSNDANTP